MASADIIDCIAVCTSALGGGEKKKNLFITCFIKEEKCGTLTAASVSGLYSSRHVEKAQCHVCPGWNGRDGILMRHAGQLCRAAVHVHIHSALTGPAACTHLYVFIILMKVVELVILDHFCLTLGLRLGVCCSRCKQGKD